MFEWHDIAQLDAHSTLLLGAPKTFGRGRVNVQTMANGDGELMTSLVLVARDGTEFAAIGLTPEQRRSLVETLSGLTDDPVCIQCASPIPRKPTGRPAVYCSDACRMAAYRERAVQREA